MKITLLVAMALCAVSAPCIAQDSLSGLYIGAGAGIESGRWNTNGVLGNSIKTSQSTRGGNLSLFSGYGVTLGRLYVGGEGGYTRSGADSRVTVPGIFGLRLGFDDILDLTTRVGYLIQPNLMAYGLGGVEFAHSAISSSGIGTVRKWQNGLRMGLGSEYVVGGGVFVRAEFGYSYFNSMKSGSGNLNPDRSDFLAGVGYRF